MIIHCYQLSIYTSKYELARVIKASCISLSMWLHRRCLSRGGSGCKRIFRSWTWHTLCAQGWLCEHSNNSGMDCLKLEQTLLYNKAMISNYITLVEIQYQWTLEEWFFLSHICPQPHQPVSDPMDSCSYFSKACENATWLHTPSSTILLMQQTCLLWKMLVLSINYLC